MQQDTTDKIIVFSRHWSIWAILLPMLVFFQTRKKKKNIQNTHLSFFF